MSCSGRCSASVCPHDCQPAGLLGWVLQALLCVAQQDCHVCFAGNDLSRSFKWGPVFEHGWIKGHASIYSTLKRVGGLIVDHCQLALPQGLSGETAAPEVELCLWPHDACALCQDCVVLCNQWLCTMLMSGVLRAWVVSVLSGVMCRLLMHRCPIWTAGGCVCCCPMPPTSRPRRMQ